MTDIRKCAQAVLDEYSKHGFMMTGYDSGQIALVKLRQALAEPVEPFAVVRYPKTGGNVGISWGAYPHEDCPYFPKDGDLLYTTPPSVDALIAEAVAKEREACAELCEYLDARWGIDSFSICAEAIRARGQK